MRAWLSEATARGPEEVGAGGRERWLHINPFGIQKYIDLIDPG